VKRQSEHSYQLYGLKLAGGILFCEMPVWAWTSAPVALRPFTRARTTRFFYARPLCSAVPTSGPNTPRVVFLGTPAVAARSLQRLAAAAKDSHGTAGAFQLVAVVTQPPAPVGRKRVVTPSAVHAAADDLGITTLLTPASARDETFLSVLSDIRPDLCITAAYGNFLPQNFLDIPRLGTLNIHPSLLPHFRGAAPVPRALEAGVSETGVSIAFTELKMDSGPILAQPRVSLSGSEHAPELLESLFDLGTDTLISLLPSVFSGDAARLATPQNHEHASHAPKLTKEEGRLTFVENAVIVHNKVRAFAGWPGTWAEFEIDRGDDKSKEPLQLKILETKVTRSVGGMCLGVHDVRLSDDGNGLAVTCDDGSALTIGSVQPSGKNPMSARSFWNGLRGKPLGRKRVPH
jgi:methionyl-tRNA formyltransferase